MTDINEFILNKLDKIDEKMDRQCSELSNQSRLLSEYNDSLKEHMRRTSLLEEKVEPMHKDWSEKQVVVKYKMKTWKKIAAGIGIAATVVGLLAGIAQLMGLI